MIDHISFNLNGMPMSELINPSMQMWTGEEFWDWRRCVEYSVKSGKLFKFSGVAL